VVAELLRLFKFRWYFLIVGFFVVVLVLRNTEALEKRETDRETYSGKREHELGVSRP
jgi:hypothetical protein